jgi:hypothetical protein
VRIITECQKDFLVYWEYSGSDQYGQPTYLTPVQMKCRWDDCIKQIFDMDGSPVFSKIELVTQRRVMPKGLVRKGKLTASINQSNPKANDNVHEIVASEETPMLKTRNIYFYEAYA